MASVFSGIGFPPQRTSAGFFALHTDEQLVRDSIHVILNTSKGSMVMTPDFGCSAHDLLFEPINVVNQNSMCRSIRADIEKWEPRVEVLSVDAYSYENTRYFKLILKMKATGDNFEIISTLSSQSN